MNETMSILLATTILALGGLGLYIYKSSDSEQKGATDEYDEEGIFGKSNFFDWNSKKEDHDEDDEPEQFDEEEYKPRRKGSKTQRNRRTNGTSKRRY